MAINKVIEQLQEVIDGTMIDNKKEENIETRRYGEGFCAGIELAQRYIRNADVLKHGRWIGIYEYCEKNGYVPSGMGIYYWCSECDKAEQKTSDFCPNCGARMDGDKK